MGQGWYGNQHASISKRHAARSCGLRCSLRFGWVADLVEKYLLAFLQRQKGEVPDLHCLETYVVDSETYVVSVLELRSGSSALYLVCNLKV